MPIIEVEDVKCPVCGDVAAVDVDDEITEPQEFECSDGHPFSITWDPIAKTATVEEIEDDFDEEAAIYSAESMLEEEEDDEDEDDLE